MRRLLLPAALVVVLAIVGVASALLGYIGRVGGGPLRAPRTLRAADQRARTDRFSRLAVRYAVDTGDGVRVSAARVLLASPGLMVRHPRRVDGRPGVGHSRRWPPARDLGPVVGRRLRRTGLIAFGLRARRPGTYYLWRTTIDYEAGARSYRRIVRGPACVSTDGGCRRGARLAPAGVPLADIGGPSDFGVALAAGSPGAAGVVVARYPATAGTRVIHLTLTNRTAHSIHVSGLRVTVRRGGARARIAGPDPFALAARAARTVRLTITQTGCAPGDRGDAAATDRLDARVDGRRVAVPLLTRLAFVPTGRC